MPPRVIVDGACVAFSWSAESPAVFIRRVSRW